MLYPVELRPRRGDRDTTDRSGPQGPKVTKDAVGLATRRFIARGASHRLARELAVEALANDRLPTLKQRVAGYRRLLAKLRRGRR